MLFEAFYYMLFLNDKLNDESKDYVNLIDKTDKINKTAKKEYVNLIEKTNKTAWSLIVEWFWKFRVNNMLQIIFKKLMFFLHKRGS